MADRLRALRRIAAVQADMARLAEWRIAAAERQIAALSEDRARLVTYMTADGGLGVPLSKAALRSVLALDRHADAAERSRVAERGKLDAVRRRERATAAAVETARREARRVAEAADLAAIVDAWFTRQT